MFQCPKCGSKDSKVADCRWTKSVMRRRRLCKDCGERFTTVEHLLEDQLTLGSDFIGTRFSVKGEDGRITFTRTDVARLRKLTQQKMNDLGSSNKDYGTYKGLRNKLIDLGDAMDLVLIGSSNE